MKRRVLGKNFLKKPAPGERVVLRWYCKIRLRRPLPSEAFLPAQDRGLLPYANRCMCVAFCSIEHTPELVHTRIRMIIYVYLRVHSNADFRAMMHMLGGKEGSGDA